MTHTELRNAIARNQQIYYNGGERPVSDSTYDGWIAELKKTTPDDPLLIAVGAPVPADSTLQKIKHAHHMGSLDNAMDEEQFFTWHKKMWNAWTQDHSADGDRGKAFPGYNVSFKMDGASAELVYRYGKLVQGSTRGNGDVGEDITANLLRMEGVPRFVEIILGKTNGGIDVIQGSPDTVRAAADKISVPFTGVVRGEIMLFNEDWKRLDTEDPSNPRNFGNGMARRKDGEGSEFLKFVAFRAMDALGAPLAETETNMLHKLKGLGFMPVVHWGGLKAEEVLKLYSFAQGEKPKGEDIFFGLGQVINRDDLPFEIDGLVVKVEDHNFQTRLGDSNNRPKAQVAFKFPSRKAITVLREVEVSVGHTGSIHPTGIVDPVACGGVTVTRCSLHNWDIIERHGVGIGDVIEIERCGDVIPGLVAVISKAQPPMTIPRPTVCPSCGGPITKRKKLDGKDRVLEFCENPNCPAQQLGKIKTWVSKLEILGLGDTFLDELYKQRILCSVADLYRTDAEWHLALVEVLGESRTAKVLAEIDKKRALSLSDFLGSLGIEGLGRRRALLVQQACPGEFDSLEDWTSGKLETMAKEIGLPRAAAGIEKQIHKLKPLIQTLLDAGVTIAETKTEKPMPKKEGTLTFVLTGKFDKPKAFYHDAITAAGHRYEESYRKGLNYLVASDPASGSAKMKKAEKDGVPVISDAKLLAMLV